MSKWPIIIIILIIAIAAWFFLLQPKVVPPAEPDSFDGAYSDLLNEINDSPSPLDLQSAVARFDGGIDSYNLPSSDKTALHDLTRVYSGYTGFLVFSAEQDSARANIDQILIGDYCQYSNLFLAEAENEKKAIDSLDLFKQNLLEFKQKYPEKATQLKFDQLTDLSSTAEWRKANQEKQTIISDFVSSCGGAS